MGILDQYKEQLAMDKENEDKLFEKETSELNEDQRTEFKKQLDKLKNNPLDMEKVYQSKMAEMRQLTENDLYINNNIKEEEVDKIVVKHAYCEDCGEELISQSPPMFNPFTFERICKHTCSKCGKQYNLEHAYPRVAFIDNKGNEIPAYGR